MQRKGTHLDTRSALLMFRNRCRLDFSNVRAIDVLMERSMTQTVRACLWTFRDLAGFGHVDVVREIACENEFKATGFRLALPTSLNWRILETLKDLIHRILLTVNTMTVPKALSTYESVWYRIPHIWYNSEKNSLEGLAFFLPGTTRMELRHVWINCNSESGAIELVESGPDVIRFTRWLRLRRSGQQALDILLNIDTGITHPYRDDILSTFNKERPKNAMHVEDKDAIHFELHTTEYEVIGVRNDTQPMFLLLTIDGTKIHRFYYINDGDVNWYPLFKHHLPKPKFQHGDRQCEACGQNLRPDEAFVTIDAQLGIFQCSCKFPWSST